MLIKTKKKFLQQDALVFPLTAQFQDLLTG